MDDLENFWSSLLSRNPVRIRQVWEDLDAEEQAAITMHLQHMATEEGWSEPQRISAQAALDALLKPDEPGSA